MKFKTSVIKKFIVLWILITVVSSANSQSDSTTNQNLTPSSGNHVNTYNNTPFNQQNNWKNWAIKGKVLPEIFLVGSGITGSIGFEWGFAKNQSIGIDYVYHKYSFDGADVYDSLSDQYISEPRQRITDEALFLNYRYYFNAQKIRQKSGIAPYLGCFTRVAKQTYIYDKGYVKTDDVVRENQVSFGIMYGLLGEINHYQRTDRSFCIDAYVGLFIKQKERIHEYPGPDKNLVRSSEFPVNYGFRIGLNLSIVSVHSRHK
ncbi:MAG: hypothetical protein IT236_16835 [Bacteroidia bacterium]|nr:hypothetical protein [Bacteroidia bacterium]